MTGIEWRNPPETWGGGRMTWRELLAPLVERPNEWAMVRACRTHNEAAQIAWQLRSGRLTKPAGEWEFVSRNGEVFARYLGEEA